MTERELACFSGFRCLAGDCPDTCCAGWEIDLDPEALHYYEAMPGALGREVRQRLRTEDGYTFFALEQGRCPFLNPAGLCRLILEQGEKALSVTCQAHPRFVEEYGSLRETCLSISCPEAARLLLDGPVELVTRQTPEPEAEEDLDEDYLKELLELREMLFSLVQTEPPASSAAAILELAGDGTLELSGFFAAMGRMEFTSPRLPAALQRVDSAVPWAEMEEPGRRLMLYFLYRYVLRAVWDGRVTEKLLLCVYAAASILCLSRCWDGPEPERVRRAASLFSREVEHSDENLALLYSFFAEKDHKYSL